MCKCEVFEEKNQNGEIVYGIKCGEVQQLISRNFVKVQKLTNKCNKYGIDPIHLSDIIEDAGIKQNKLQQRPAFGWALTLNGILKAKL